MLLTQSTRFFFLTASPTIGPNQERERKSVELLVEDNGIGLPADLDPRKTASLGLGLVCILAEQLEAEVEVRRDQGTAFRITFHPG